MFSAVLGFIFSHTLQKQTSLRWSLVVLYLVLIFPSMLLLAYCQSAEKHKKKWNVFESLLFYLCWMAPTMFLTAAMAIAAVGSTFAGYVPLFWLIALITSIIGLFCFTNKSKRS